MIIVEIKGGLGNQMFQYAFGRALATRNHTDMTLDVSAYTATKGDPMKGIRLFGLSYFNIEQELVSVDKVEPFGVYKKNNLLSKIIRYINRTGSYYNKSYIEEPKQNFFSFDPNIINRSIGNKDVYVTGYWQSEKYFKDISEKIRKELTVRSEPEGKNSEVLSAMANQNAVAIHIRHGDNANSVAAQHGVLQMDFYKRAVELITSKVSDPVFYLFSDDIAWAREQLSYIKNLVVVDWNGDEKNHEDMRLMYSCKHHIIANSTFSWWGAWLAKHDGQIVVAPAKYHQTGDQKYPDYYPSEWVII